MTPLRKTSAEVIADASGRWPYILDDLSSGMLSDAIASWQKHPNHHVDCPICGGSDKFRLFKDFSETGGGVCSHCGTFKRGVALLAAINNSDPKDAFREVAKWVRGEEVTPTVHQRAPIAAPKPPDPKRAKERIREARAKSTGIFGTLGEQYLVNRGIEVANISKKLKYHPGMDYYDQKQKKVLGTFGCMIAEVTDKKGKVVCLHRTFIGPDGKKAPVPKAKKLMEKIEDLNGCSVKLFPATEVLGVAEGIETALAAYAVARIPVWCCISAGLLECVDVPDSVRHVVIFADLDRSGTGLRSAEVLAERLSTTLDENGKPKWTVEIVIPEGPIPDGEKGVDWNDVLKKQGVDGFPSRWRNCRPRGALPAIVRSKPPVPAVAPGTPLPASARTPALAVAA
jgi:putative DNA primase/helicase